MTVVTVAARLSVVTRVAESQRWDGQCLISEVLMISMQPDYAVSVKDPMIIKGLYFYVACV